MRSSLPSPQDQTAQQEKQRAVGLILLLAAVVAGFVLQVGFLPREALAIHSTRLSSAQEQVAEFAPAGAAPRAQHDFLKPRARPARLRPAASSRHGQSQPTADRTARTASRQQPRVSGAARSGQTLTRPLVAAQATRDPGPTAAAQIAPPGDIGLGATGNMQTPDPGASPTRATEAVAEASGDGPAEPPEVEWPASVPHEPRIPGARARDGQEARMLVLGPADAREGELVTYAISVEGARELAHSPVRVTFDPQILEFVEAQEGPMLSADGAPTRFQVGHGGGEGVIDVLVSRTEPGRGLTGSGVLFTVSFLAHAQGETPLLITGSSLMDGSGRRIPFQGEDAGISVKP